jgi:hypothetical protein
MTISPLLIQISDFHPYVDISDHIEQDALEPFIRAAQDTDLEAILGSAFYAALIDDYSSQSNAFTVYADLVNGAVYTDKDNLSLRYSGIKPILVYYAWARLLATSNIQHTPFGMVVKTSDYQTPANDKQLKMQVEQARNDANYYVIKLKNWLDRQVELKTSGYSFWDKNCKTTTIQKHRVRVGKI